MKTFFAGLALFIFLTNCGQHKAELTDNPPFVIGISVGEIKEKRLSEISGIVASVNNPGLFWVHNDSGNDADIFLIDDKGRVTCTVHLSGIKNRDWEDITLGPGPEKGKNYLYIGDIGDNAAVYSNKFLYRIEEPIAQSSDTTISSIDKITFKLSDGSRDSEALMIDPVSNNFYIFSKRERKVNLYKLSLPFSTTETMTAERVLENLPFTLIVAADISKDGREILAKNYDQVFYWKRSVKESIESTVARTPETLPYSTEPQGEAIAFDRNGKGYYTISERKKKGNQLLYFYSRK